MTPLLTAVALDGAGFHPAAWRERSVGVQDLFAPERIVSLTQRAETAGVDLVTLADSLGPAGSGPGEVTARLDALAVLARIAPVTERIGLVPTVTTTHTEPFHLQAAVATLDWVSAGRAGWQIQVSDTELEAQHIGRRTAADPSVLWAEATEVAEVSRLLWDSWEDDAEIRDLATGRFIDRDRLHYTDYVGSTFSVKGPSIVPRPPQGHPVTFVALTGPESLPTVAAAADVVLIDETDLDAAVAALATVGDAVRRRGRETEQVRALIAVSVLLENDPGTARTRRERLDARSRRRTPLDHVGTVDSLLPLIERLAETGFDGVLLRPAVLDTDLPTITDDLLPRLRDSGLAGPNTPGPLTLRDRLGLPRPANHFATEHFAADHFAADRPAELRRGA
jgi:alkanesulfonate monooxygenase SsuD/methylene tetrahydromethanopterin reductase-like flavin-dependent oxidoreductase (luciferase family)